jgi:hypothetical protein
MMKKMAFLFAFSFFTMLSYAQDANVDNPVGRRVNQDGFDYPIYLDNKGMPDLSNWRKLDPRVYFRLIKMPVVQSTDGKTHYQFITIPGSSKKVSQDTKNNLKGNTILPDPRNGLSIGKEDFDQNFWIDTSYLYQKTQLEYYMWENDIYYGALTAPFKYRFKAGSAGESYIDGSFNVGPFLGYKIRVSKTKPYYFSIVAFTEITTLNYTSSDNTGITDPSKKESGSGLVYGGGVFFRFYKVSPGIVIGWDHGFGDLGKTFIYSDRPWISFSLNFEFLAPAQTTAPKN